MSRDKYFAAADAPECVEYLLRKGSIWFDSIHFNSYLEKIKKSWLSYHGVYYEDGHAVTFGGEGGELVNLPVNHYSNIAQNIVNMITATRPAFQARSVNTDYKSQVQTTLANGLLEFYMREKRLEVYLKKAAEYAVVLGSGFIKMEWNATSGEIYDYIEPTEPFDDEGNEVKPSPIYQGDVEFRNLSPFDVVFDNTKESAMDHDWVLCRTFKNKYDLMAKFPDLAEQIKGAATKSDNQKYRISLSPLDDTSDIPVYEFFHKRTESMPNGRYIQFLDNDVVMVDALMPYRKLPIYRIAPRDILGTPYGYTPMFDLLPLQDAANSLYSTVLTNQNAFGVQNVLNPRGNDIRINQVQGGLNFIDYNPTVAGGQDGKPTSLNLTNTPKEIFDFMGILVRDMETISGVNSVARGNPESSLRSGNALALVQSQALQFVSGLQQSYVMMIEDLGTGLIQLLQDFAAVPRIAEISGVSNKSKMKEFTGRDIDSINRVVVDVGNALATTAAGRSQMADNLLQMGLITTPEQYFSVMNTGKLETMTEGSSDQSTLVKAENERLTEGLTPVIATALDKHSFHIRSHMNVLADPDLRLDTELVQRVLAHVQEHITLLRTTDPDMLTVIGEQPLSPPGGSPANQVPPQGLTENQSAAAQNNSQLIQNNEAVTTAPDISGIPQPAQVNPSLTASGKGLPPS